MYLLVVLIFSTFAFDIHLFRKNWNEFAQRDRKSMVFTTLTNDIDGLSPNQFYRPDGEYTELGHFRDVCVGVYMLGSNILPGLLGKYFGAQCTRYEVDWNGFQRCADWNYKPWVELSSIAFKNMRVELEQVFEMMNDKYGSCSWGDYIRLYEEIVVLLRTYITSQNLFCDEFGNDYGYKLIAQRYGYLELEKKMWKKYATLLLDLKYWSVKKLENVSEACADDVSYAILEDGVILKKEYYLKLLRVAWEWVKYFGLEERKDLFDLDVLKYDDMSVEDLMKVFKNQKFQKYWEDASDWYNQLPSEKSTKEEKGVGEMEKELEK